METTVLEIRHLKTLHALREADSLVEAANKGLPSWSAIQHYRIINCELTVESGLLTPTMKVKRPAFLERFKNIIDDFYETSES